MSTIKPDPEEYLDFHFGKKEEYSRTHTTLAMIGFCSETVEAMVSHTFAKRPKEARPKIHSKGFDPLWGTATRIKINWLIDGKITSQQYDSFGACDIFFLLRMGVREEDITPGRVLEGITSARWNIMNKKLNKN